MDPAPGEAHKGAIVCVTGGAPVLYTLREHKSCYQVVGDRYVHGLMDADAFELDYFKLEMLPLF